MFTSNTGYEIRCISCGKINDEHETSTYCTSCGDVLEVRYNMPLNQIQYPLKEITPDPLKQGLLR